MKPTITLLTLLFLGILSFAQTIINVPDDQPTIQDGIDAAEDGDIVLVAQGTYFENIDFTGKAITVASHWLNEEDSAHILNTIIDGSQPANPFWGTCVYMGSGEDTTSVLCGFTVQNGSGNYPTAWGDHAGGGILVNHSGGKVINNRIINNHVWTNGLLGYGGGISVASEFDDSFVLRDNFIANNEVVVPASPATSCYGGGLWIYNLDIVVEHNIFRNNYGEGWPEGGGLAVSYCNGIIRHNLFDSNTLLNTTTNSNAGSYGGGMVVFMPNPLVIVSQNTIVNNVTEGANYPLGGGLAVYNTELEGDVLIERNRISNNKARRGGGVVLALDYPGCILRNNIIDTNKATQWGGAIYIFHNLNKKESNFHVATEIPESSADRSSKSTAIPFFVNNTFAYNKAEVAGGAIYNIYSNADVVIMNNIFHGNLGLYGDDLYTDAEDYKSYLYNNNIDTDGIYGDWDGEDNIFEEDPGFYLDTYHLMVSSPCKNEGTDDVSVNGNFFYAPEIDFDGESRPQEGDFDIGADEWFDYSLSLDKAFVPEPQMLSVFPNPVADHAVIGFDIREPGKVEIILHDINGSLVSKVINSHFGKGSNQIQLNLSSLNPGIYFCTIKTNNGTSTQKIVKL